MIFLAGHLAQSAPIIIFKGFRGWEASVAPSRYLFRCIGQSRVETGGPPLQELFKIMGLVQTGSERKKVREGESAVHPLWRDLFSAGIYKRSQGRIARQVTFAALAVGIAMGAWRLHQFMADWLPVTAQLGVSVALLVVGVWVCYRAVNMPRFADFLIAVEAEMNKVSWPSRGELFRSSMVVIITMFGLAATLYFYDLLWQLLLTRLGVLRG